MLNRKKLSVAGVALLSLSLSGCGDSHESVMQDMLATMKEFNETLKTIKDADSAKANSGKLKSIAEKIESVSARGEKLGKPSDEEKKRLETKYEKELTDVMGTLFGEMMRVAMLGPEVQKELEAVQKAMEKAK